MAKGIVWEGVRWLTFYVYLMPYGVGSWAIVRRFRFDANFPEDGRLATCVYVMFDFSLSNDYVTVEI